MGGNSGSSHLGSLGHGYFDWGPGGGIHLVRGHSGGRHLDSCLGGSHLGRGPGGGCHPGGGHSGGSYFGGGPSDSSIGHP